MALDPQARRPGGRTGGMIARLTTETKQAFKTTEFWAFVAVLAGILIAAAMIGEGDSGAEGGDPFNAFDAWRLITFLTIGYMIARGLAKAGSRDPYWATESDLPGGKGRDQNE